MLEHIRDAKELLISVQQGLGLQPECGIRGCLPGGRLQPFDQALAEVGRRPNRQGLFQRLDHTFDLFHQIQRLRQRHVLGQHLLEQFAAIGAANMRVVGRIIDRALPLPERAGLAKAALAGVGAEYGQPQCLGRVQLGGPQLGPDE